MNVVVITYGPYVVELLLAMETATNQTHTNQIIHTKTISRKFFHK